MSEQARNTSGAFVHLPSKVCNAGGSLFTAMQLLSPGRPIQENDVKKAVERMVSVTKSTADEFSPHDLHAGASIAALRRLAIAMVEQGSV